MNRTIVRVFVGVIFSVALFIGVTSVPAQSASQATVSPLIMDDTALVVRLNVERFDLSVLMQKLVATINTVTDRLAAEGVLQKEQADQTKMMAPMFLAMGASQITPLFTSLKEGGMNEIFFVGAASSPTTFVLAEAVDGQKTEAAALDPSKAPVSFFAIPVGNRTADDLKAVQTNLNMLKGFTPVKQVFLRHGYLFAAMNSPTLSLDDDTFRQAIRERFGEFKPVNRPQFAAGLGAFPDAAVSVVFLTTPEMKAELLKNLDDLVAMVAQQDDAQAKSVAEAMKSRLPEFVNGLDSATLAIESDFAAAEIRVGMTSAAVAAKVPELLATVRKEVVAAVSQADAEKGPKAASLMDGILATLAPTVNGSGVTWRFDAAWWNKNIPAITEYIKLAIPKIDQKLDDKK